MTEKHRNMLNELLADDSDKMNAWEVEFLDSLDSQDGWVGELSGNQADKLAQIWAKVFA